MFRFVLDRLVQALIVLLAVSFLVYLLIGLMPGDPIDIMASGNPDMTPADAERLRALHGLDLPIWQRYLGWLGNALQGDFGWSRQFGLPVLDVLWPRLGNTLILLGCALALALALAVPLGVAAARKPGGWVDNGINLFCFAGISMPPFWLALLLILLFAVQLQWLPAGGMESLGEGSGGLLDRLHYLILPVITLTLLSTATYTRHIRAAMIAELRQDYIRTATAKGVPPARVRRRHALRNALTPLITVLALDIGMLFGGALVTETMFSYSGMGKLIYDSILANDFNLALIGLLMATMMILLANFLADIAYAVADPRVTFRRTR